MKNVISFSLWGYNPRYTHGAIHNIDLAKKLYPDWICRFYIDPNDSPPDIVQKIIESGSEIVYRDNNRDTLGMMWRFEVMFDKTVDKFLIRDADSRIYYREVVAVNEWIASGKGFHVMRDHPHHSGAILGGMWGGKTSCCMEYENIYNSYINNPDIPVVRGSDQEFLWKYIWPNIKQNTLCHDSCKTYGGCDGAELMFTVPLENNLFVGGVIDHNETGLDAYSKYVNIH